MTAPADGVTVRVGDLALAKIAAHVAGRTPGVRRLAPGLAGRLAPAWAPGVRRDLGVTVQRDPDGGVEVAVRVVVGADFANDPADEPAPVAVVSAVARRMHDELTALGQGEVRPEVTVVDLEL